MRLLPLIALLLASPAAAHEFWLEPTEFRIDVDDKIIAKTINGEEFSGSEFSYSPRGFQRSGIIAGQANTTISGDMGQRPAVQVAPAGPGLNILFHQTAAQTIVYEDMERFVRFLQGKRLDAVVAEHEARGLPTEDIVEGYFRFAKALVAVGDGAGADRSTGLTYELIALDNPYTSGGDIRYQLLYRGKAEAGEPVYIYHRQGTKVQKLTLRTDGNGRVTVPRMPGEFMINAVKIMPAGKTLQERVDAVWQTLWASSVYQIDG